MNQDLAVAPSYALTTALVEFRRFLVDDDVERSDLIEGADWDTLKAFVERVAPLFGEISGLRSRLTALPRPLSEDLEVLESDLKWLAQAGMEAQLVLRERGGEF